MADEDSSSGGFRRERNLSSRNFNKPGTSRRRFSTESRNSPESKSLSNSPTKHDDTPALTLDFSESSSCNAPSLSTDPDPLIGATGSSELKTLHLETDDSSTVFCEKVGLLDPDLLSDSSYTFDVTGSEMFNASLFSTPSDQVVWATPRSKIVEPEHLSLSFADSEGQSTLHGRSELKTEFNDDINLEENRDYAGISQGAYKKQLQKQTSTSSAQSSPSPHTPDPALLGVKQKLLMFENLKKGNYKSKSTQPLLDSEHTTSSSPPQLYQAYPPVSGDNVPLMRGKNKSIEEHSEDEVESITDEVADNNKPQRSDSFGTSSSAVDAEVKEEDVPVAAINKSFLTPLFQHSKDGEAKAVSPDKLKSPLEETLGRDTTTEATVITTQKPRNKDFPRNFRSRPKTEALEATSEPLLSEASKRQSHHSKQNSAEPDEDEQIELRDKGFSFVRPILEELIKTEETYVQNLWIGINNYGKIFERKDLRPGLRGKKYVLFGNIEQIAEFHRDEFLPMLQRNKQDLKRIFDEFQRYIDNNYFYGYVLFTMNKQRSLELCETYKNYFKLLQSEIDDKLGINSFLVQPIQRMARYPLLLQQFINTLFKKYREYEMKPIIESCCRLEKKLRNLLITTNESEIINDIVGTGDANEFNTFYQGKFRKVSEFHCFDHTLKRGYRSKVFIFDKCIIYTEIKGKQLIFHGRYPCEHIGIISKQKQFTLFYEHRKQQECDFTADPPLIEQWLELITDMIKSYAEEERRKLKELHSHEFGGDHMHRKPANLSLFRDSNRFSTDSGIGNIWVVPKPEQDEAVSNRTTWYALT